MITESAGADSSDGASTYCYTGEQAYRNRQQTPTKQQGVSTYDVPARDPVPHESRLDIRMLIRCRIICSTAITKQATTSTRVAAMPR